MVFWRRDGKELYYLAADRGIMAVEVGAATHAKFGKPRVLFRPAAEIAPGVRPGTASVSRDGERFVIAVPRPQLRQLTVFDRQGKVVSTVGQPGFIRPAESVSRRQRARSSCGTIPRRGNVDIWTMDLASGNGTPITNDTPPENAPIWSPDGKHVAYVSTAKGYAGIYRKAADGTGEAELLFQYTPGAGMVLTDWSPDGKFLTFYTGVIVLVAGGHARNALEPKRDRLAARGLRRGPGPVLARQSIPRVPLERSRRRQRRGLRPSVRSRASRTLHRRVLPCRYPRTAPSA